jgi:hypothetical protein
MHNVAFRTTVSVVAAFQPISISNYAVAQS